MLSVNLVYGTYGESGILTSINNTRRMLELLDPEVRLYENAPRICDVIHAHTFGPIALFLALLHKAYRRVVVIHAHTTPQDVRSSYVAASFLSIFLRRYLKFYYNLADVCIAPSLYTKDVLITTLGVRRRIEVVSNGIDLNLYSCDQERANTFRKRYAIGDRPLILSVGLVFMRKGIADFVEVARIFPEFQFAWAGRILASPFLPRRTREILRNAPPNVLFTGRVENICDPLSAAQIFVFPSYEENQGIAVLEAAACSLPIVIRDLPVYTGYVHERDCIKFTSRRELAAAIQELVTNKTKAGLLGQNAREAVQKHDIRVIGRKLLRVYLSAKVR